MNETTIAEESEKTRTNTHTHRNMVIIPGNIRKDGKAHSTEDTH